MNWGGEDYLAAAILLGGALICVAVVRRLAPRPALRIVGYGLVLAALLLIWAELAVGIFH